MAEGKPIGLAALLGNPLLALVCYLAAGLVFIYASLKKIAHPAIFAIIINNYQILLRGLINIAAILLTHSLLTLFRLAAISLDRFMESA